MDEAARYIYKLIKEDIVLSGGLLFDVPESQRIFVRFRSAEDLKGFEERAGVKVKYVSEVSYPSRNRLRMDMSWIPSRTSGSASGEAWWIKHWQGMPEFNQVKQRAHKKLAVYLDPVDGVLDDFAQVVDQKITQKTKAIWYPELERGVNSGLSWYTDQPVVPQFPVYVISKGRPTCLTSRILDTMGVEHRIVIEPVDYDEYADKIGASRLLVLPFSDLGQGSIPARNWVWDHAISEGWQWHWILDDNIEGFNRLTDNKRIKVRTGAMFKAAEDFVLRYENIGQAGFNYYSFCKPNDCVSPMVLNTRVYSCILIRNDVEHRWRGKYNEDTDLSLRILKDGMCTVLFNSFLAGKVTTQRMRGGNTDQVYVDGDDRRKFAESLVEQHPDVARVVWKFGRWHHQVDYRGFKDNELVMRDGVCVQKGVDNYGMYIGEDA